MLRCTRPPLATMTDEEFQTDLCQFLTERMEADLAKQLVNKRVTWCAFLASHFLSLINYLLEDLWAAQSTHVVAETIQRNCHHQCV